MSEYLKFMEKYFPYSSKIPNEDKIYQLVCENNLMVGIILSNMDASRFYLNEEKLIFYRRYRDGVNKILIYIPLNDKYPYGKPQTDEVARGSGNREYGCRRLKEKLPNFSGVSFFRAGNSSNRVNAFHICVYVHRCAVPRYIALQHP